jgi:hypothetical protein
MNALPSSVFSELPDSVSAAWAVSRSLGPPWSLHRLVPIGFDAYIRVLHPAWMQQAMYGNENAGWRRLASLEGAYVHPVPWADVAEKKTREVHRTTLWGDVCSSDNEQPSDLIDPIEGEVTLEILDAFFAALTESDGPEQEVICGFWQGHESVHGLTAPVVEGIGQQGHILVKTALGVLYHYWQRVLQDPECESCGRVPQFFFPASRRWFFHAPFELDSCFFGGAYSIVHELLLSRSVEAFEVFEGDHFMYPRG